MEAAICSLAPLLRGRDTRSLLLEGWGEGLHPRVEYVDRALFPFSPQERGEGEETCQFPAIIHPRAETATRSRTIFKNFPGNVSLTVKGRKGFDHTRYAGVSISDAPVSECDRACRRSVNIARSPSMKYCKRP